MKDRKLIALNQKYYKFIPVIGLLLAASLFLPFINIKEEGLSVSFFAILIKAMQNTGLFQDNVMLGILVLLVLAASVLAFVSSLLAIFLRKKGAVIFSVLVYIFCSLSVMVVLFTITRSVNASGLINVKFLIKYLGTGYWALFFLSFAGLTVSLLTAKISPGYIVLVLMSVIWLIPILWVILISFREEGGSYTSYFFPKKLTFNNYIVLLTDSSRFPYLRWYGNTLFVAVCSCALTTLIVLSTAYTLSRLRFKGRKTFMNILLILGMFPGFMSMIAVYYILKGLGITQSLIALILVYSGGAALSYYIAKGFFDTIPKALDEAAYIDGATNWYIFTRIIIPLSKPIIIYTLLISFMSPWADYIFASVIMGDNYENYTLALGLHLMLTKQNIDTWYTRFAAGAVLVSIPTAILFISLQKYFTASVAGSVKG